MKALLHRSSQNWGLEKNALLGAAVKGTFQAGKTLFGASRGLAGAKAAHAGSVRNVSKLGTHASNLARNKMKITGQGGYNKTLGNMQSAQNKYNNANIAFKKSLSDTKQALGKTIGTGLGKGMNLGTKGYSQLKDSARNRLSVGLGYGRSAGIGAAKAAVGGIKSGLGAMNPLSRVGSTGAMNRAIGKDNKGATFLGSIGNAYTSERGN